MTSFDSPWKETLDVFFVPFLELLFPTIHGDVDWSRGHEFLDKELQQIVPEAALGKGEVDKLVKVWLTDGQENWLLLHLEVQAQQETDFARRMFGYNYRIVDRYNREVVSAAILGDERPSWRPHLFRTARWGCRTEFEFPIVKLLDWQERAGELEASHNPVAKIILAHLRALETQKTPESRRLHKFQLVRSLYDGGFDANQVRQLFRLIDWMMGLPAGLEQQFQQEVFKIEEDRRMPYVTSVERMALERGKQEGRQEGREEGGVAALVAAIERLLLLKFGDPATALMPNVRKITRSERLQILLTELYTLSTLEAAQERIQANALAEEAKP
jgi:hypothetical protein